MPLLASPHLANPRLLRETFEPELLTPSSVLQPAGPTQAVVEVGPRSSFQTAWSTNAVSICASVGLGKVARLERSRRYLLTSTRPLAPEEAKHFAALVRGAAGGGVLLLWIRSSLCGQGSLRAAAAAPQLRPRLFSRGRTAAHLSPC